MKNIVAALGLGAIALLASASAQALPVVGASAGETEITLAAFGCGPYAHPDRFGRCEPNRPRYFAPRPRYFAPPPRCFVRMTPYGPRRFCR